MSFLTIENGEVCPTAEGWLIPQVKAVYNADKTDGKGFFKDVLTYVFFVYKKDGVYADTFDEYRKKMVIERHLPKRDAEALESNKRVKELIQEYLDRQLTKNERLLYKLELDIEKLLDRISDIPYTKCITMKVPHVGGDGETTFIATKVEMDNSEEKSKTIKIAESMIDYGDKLRNKILKDKVEKKKKGSTSRLFDKAK